MFVSMYSNLCFNMCNVLMEPGRSVLQVFEVHIFKCNLFICLSDRMCI